MKKRAFSLLLTVVMAVSLIIPVTAKNADCLAAVVSGGMSHSLAIKPDGSVWAWGSNDFLQLGQPKDVTGSRQPVKVEGMPSATAVAAGHYFSLALSYSGQVYGWGGDFHSDKPTLISGVENVVAIAAGQADCLALTQSGSVWQWKVGDSPAAVSGVSNIIAISAGSAHFLALDRSGSVWAWGGNWNGQLGNGSTKDSDKPVRVSGLNNIVDIAAGFKHSLAVSFDGTVYAWGSNDYDALGTVKLENADMSSRPLEVSGPKKVVQVAAGNGTSMALTSDGRLYTWGHGEYGELGSQKVLTSRAQAVQVLDNIQSSTLTFIAAGQSHNLCVGSGGELYSWGRNKDGQTGVKDNSLVHVPARVLTGVASGSPYLTCTFSDVDSWAEEEIKELYDRQLVPPILWGNYRSSITRAGLAHLLVTVYERAKRTTITPAKNEFTDIEGHQFQTDLLKAYRLGILTGKPDQKLAPNVPVRRDEAAKMICSFASKMTGNSIPKEIRPLTYYMDAAQIGQWAAPYVDYAYSYNIMKGSGGKFYPANNFTREESLLVVARLAERYSWNAK